jgi:hypothetical protein
MAECGLSREEIAKRLSLKLGRLISTSILNDFTATTKAGARFPAAYVSAFCEVTGDNRLRLFLLDPSCDALREPGKKALSAAGVRMLSIDAILKTQMRDLG